MSFYHRNVARQQQQQQQWLQKRRQENAQRRLAGEEPLPEEDPALFKPIPEPSPLDVYLINNQVGHLSAFYFITLAPRHRDAGHLMCGRLPGLGSVNFLSGILAPCLLQNVRGTTDGTRLCNLSLSKAERFADAEVLDLQVDNYCQSINHFGAQTLEKLHMLDGLHKARVTV